MRSPAWLLSLLFAFSVAGQGLREEMIVTPEWLAGHLSRAAIIEVGDRVTYESGHIRGARLVEVHELLCERDGVQNELPHWTALEKIFMRAGARDRGRIVIYAADPILAARAWFTLDHLGHGDRAAILDGGRARWVAEGRELTTVVPAAGVEPFYARVRRGSAARLHAMKELVAHSDEFGSRLVILDSRAADAFRGTVAGQGVARAGHIPGAVNIPWDENLTRGNIQRFLPATELRELYESAGVGESTANVVYCRTGMQAAVTYFVLRYLGYEASLYDGSFEEWSSEPETEVVM